MYRSATLSLVRTFRSLLYTPHLGLFCTHVQQRLLYTHPHMQKSLLFTHTTRTCVRAQKVYDQDLQIHKKDVYVNVTKASRSCGCECETKSLALLWMCECNEQTHICADV